MILYLETSALAKLIISEPASEAVSSAVITAPGRGHPPDRLRGDALSGDIEN